MVITPISIIKFFKLFSKCELDVFRINSVLDSYDAIYLRKCCSIHLSSFILLLEFLVSWEVGEIPEKNYSIPINLDN